jgi:aryl-alcohol dehydrogenase-like predicted oxidoreductase
MSEMVAARDFGASGLRISEIGFGCGAGAGLMIGDDAQAQQAAVARALELGVTYFDTAPVYGDRRSEQNLGRALRGLGADPIVVTKVALATDELHDIEGAVVRSVEESLARLGRERVEAVFLHNRVAARRSATPNVRVGALLTVDDVLGSHGVVSGLERLRTRGLVRYFGCCGFGGEPAAVDELIASDRFEAMLVHYNLINQTAFRPAVAGSSIDDYAQTATRAAARGMGLVVLRVLEAGLLADNSREEGRPVTDLFRARIPALSFLRDDAGELGPAAIRFALSSAAVSTVLIGVSEAHQVDAAVSAAMAGPLSDAALERLERVRLADYR